MASLLVIPNDGLSHLYVDAGAQNTAKWLFSLPQSSYQSPSMVSNTGDVFFAFAKSGSISNGRHLGGVVRSTLFSLLGSVQHTACQPLHGGCRSCYKDLFQFVMLHSRCTKTPSNQKVFACTSPFAYLSSTIFPICTTTLCLVLT